MTQDDAERLKVQAGEAAAALVRPGMRLGLGTGSTARHVIEALGRRLASGELRDVAGVPTSVATERLAIENGIAIIDLESTGPLDLTIDGADEITPELVLTKGGGGALVREKIVASASRSMVVIADGSKLVQRPATRLPLPIAVVPFGWPSLVPALSGLGAVPVLRRGPDGAPFVTDDGLFVLDCAFEGGIEDPAGLESALCGVPGVVASGLFIGMADRAIVAEAGTAGVRTIEAVSRPRPARS